MTTTLPVTITEPGVYDMPDDVYHADPVPGGSLSSTGARKLLSPSCPALFAHWRDSEERETKAAWDEGHAAHKLVLGAGPELVIVADEWGKDPNEWRTNNAKAAVQAVRNRGATPVKPAAMERVHAMADALRGRRTAATLFAPGTGKPEQTIVWRDAQTGAWCRALLDWLPNPTSSRFIFRDYKTCAASAIQKPDRVIDDLGYYVQAAFHVAGLQALGIAGPDAAALLVLQSKDPPYLVREVQLDPIAMQIGAIRVREAQRLYAECSAAERSGDPNAWPSWSDDVELISLPGWVERQYEMELSQ